MVELWAPDVLYLIGAAFVLGLGVGAWAHYISTVKQRTP